MLSQQTGSVKYKILESGTNLSNDFQTGSALSYAGSAHPILSPLPAEAPGTAPLLWVSGENPSIYLEIPSLLL